MYSTTIKNEDWIWLAGFIDGEGYLGILRQQKKATTNQSATYLYHPYLIITGTDFMCIHGIRSMTGIGRIYKTIRADKGHKTAYQYKLSRFDDLTRVLAYVGPHLKIKNKQSDLLKKFIKIRLSKKPIVGRGSRGISTFSIEEEVIFQKLLKLNKRGL